MSLGHLICAIEARVERFDRAADGQPGSEGYERPAVLGKGEAGVAKQDREGERTGGGPPGVLAAAAAGGLTVGEDEERRAVGRGCGGCDRGGAGVGRVDFVVVVDFVDEGGGRRGPRGRRR